MKSFGIDHRKQDYEDKVGENGKKKVGEGVFKLEHTDKTGKTLTIKEAFRQMCWRFHGKMPSHRKQEKIRLKEEAKTKKNFT